LKRVYGLIKNAKLRNKLMASYLVACFVPLLLSTMVIRYFAVKNLEEDSMELAMIYSTQVVSNIENLVEDYDRLTKSAVVDNDILTIINSDKEPSVSAQIDYQLQARKLLLRMAILRPDVDNIMLLTKVGGFYQYNTSGTSVNRQLLMEEAWLKRLTESRQVLTFTGAHFKDCYDVGQDGIVVTVGRKLYNTVGTEVGMVLIDMNPFDLVELNDTFKLTRSEYHIRIRVSAEDGAVLYDSDVIDGKLTWQDVTDGNTQVLPEEKDCIVIRDTAHDGQLGVEALIPRRQLMEKATRITWVAMLAIGVSVLMILGFSSVLSKAITKPITELQEKMEQVGEGSYGRLEGFESSDEIGILIDNYNSMVSKIQSLIRDVYLAQISQKDAKLMALRTQINPHMLYNTLESIRMKALVKGDVEVAEMIKILARMFRASLGREDGSHTIRAELEYVENYLRLQNIRFQGQFEFSYEMEEELLDVGIVPLVFQPIVENCIEHGNRGHYEKLHIEIKGRRISDTAVEILFRDDGKGMEPEQRQQVNRRLENVSEEYTQSGQEGDSIGLYNIAQRIFLRYGQEYGLQVAKSSESGTVIRMRIPIGDRKQKDTE